MLADAGDLVGVTVTLIVNEVEPGSWSCLAVSVGESMRVTWLAGGLESLAQINRVRFGQASAVLCHPVHDLVPAIPE